MNNTISNSASVSNTANRNTSSLPKLVLPTAVMLVALAGAVLGYFYQYIFHYPEISATYWHNRLLFSSILTPILAVGAWFALGRMLAGGTGEQRAAVLIDNARPFAILLLTPLALLFPAALWIFLLLAIFALALAYVNRCRMRPLLRTSRLDGPRLVLAAFLILSLLISTCEINENVYNYHHLESHYGLFAKNLLKFPLAQTKLLYTYGQGVELPAKVEHYLSHPPLFADLLAIDYLYLGISNWSTRLLPIFLFLGSVFLIYRIACSIVGRRLALVTLPFAVLFPMSMYYGPKGMISAAVFFALLAVAAYLHFLKQRTFPNLLILLLGIFLAAYSDWYGALIAPFILMHYAVFHVRSTWDFFCLCAGAAGFALLMALIVLHLSQGDQGIETLISKFQHRTSSNLGNLQTMFTFPQWLARQFEYFTLHYTILTALIVAVWITGLSYRLLAGHVNAQDGLGLMMFLWGISFVFIFKNQSFQHEFSLFTATAAFAIMPAQIIDWSARLKRRSLSGREGFAITSCVTVYAAALLALGLPYAVELHQRGTADYISTKPETNVQWNIHPLVTHLNRVTRPQETVLSTFTMSPEAAFNRPYWILDRKVTEVASVDALEQSRAKLAARYAMTGHTLFRPSQNGGMGPMPQELARHILMNYSNTVMGDYALTDFTQKSNLETGLPADAIKSAHTLNRSYKLVGFYPPKPVTIQRYGALTRYFNSINPWYAPMATRCDVTYFLEVLGPEDAQQPVTSYIFDPWRLQNPVATSPSIASIVNIFRPAAFLPAGTVIKVTYTHWLSHQAPAGSQYHLRLGANALTICDDLGVVTLNDATTTTTTVKAPRAEDLFIRKRESGTLIVSNFLCNVKFEGGVTIRQIRIQERANIMQVSAIVEVEKAQSEDLMFFVHFKDSGRTTLMGADHPLPPVRGPQATQTLKIVQIDPNFDFNNVKYIRIGLLSRPKGRQRILASDLPVADTDHVAEFSPKLIP